MNQRKQACEMLEAYVEGFLPSAEHNSFETHLTGCEECKNQVEAVRLIRRAIEPVIQMTIPDDSDLRIRTAMHQKTRQVLSDRDVMDIEEAAVFLGITVAELVNCLDELPAFEIAGRIRFNRDRLIHWMEMKERDLAWEIQQGRSSNRGKLLTFPGGPSNDQCDDKTSGRLL